MGRYRKGGGSFFAVFLSMGVALLLAACGGGGGSDAPAASGGAATTTISGKVTLSSTVTAKPALQKAMLGAPKGKPGGKAYAASKRKSTALSSALFAPVLNATAFSNGTVYLYNSDHPEWLAPVASGTTDSAGAFTLTKLANASTNNNAYTDGDAIPAGNYTLLAYKSGGFDPILGVTTKDLVAVQTVVSKFEGAVTVPDLVAQESTALPTVSAMFGVKQNTDGTQTWGSSATNVAANAAIQVSFSAAMSRGTLTSGITISPAVSGKWSLSADWTTATFYSDTGVTLTPGTVYTITVKGSDTGASAAVKNVYGNALAKTATGTFTATAVDTVMPTAEWESPTLLEMAAAVDVTKPIRIRSNKELDVNSLTLDGKIAGVSSLGAKPGVLYVGKNVSGFYVYEFVLGVPLKLATTYDLTVSGGKGLNGKAMNTLSGSLITTSAAATTGVDPNATVVTQDAQAAVKDVLGKWIRAFSDRNITQLQSVMSGDFYFEEAQINNSSDLNKDGRLSLAEFSTMLTTQAFPNWEFCGMTITGDVVGTINVVGDLADFEFTMTGTSANTSQTCVSSLPGGSFYATVQKLNGAWTIVRASNGIDTRTKNVSFPNLISNLVLAQGGVTISNGGQALLPYDPMTLMEVNPITWSWDATTGVSSYVLVRMDARNPQNGKACAVATTVTSFASGSDCVLSGGVDVSGMFGFNTAPATGNFHVDGGQYYWEVIGLGTTSTTNIASKTALDILKDISAISALNSYSIAGVYKEITVKVYGGVTATGTPVTYSVNYNGYDVGAANQATITVTTANTAATAGQLDVQGNFSKSYPLVFTNGVATVTVDLSTGYNWINVSDWLGLNKSFSISTTGGLAPKVAITSIKDQLGNAIVGDQWHYYTATGATKVTVTGAVSDPTITAVDVNVWNNNSSAYSYVSAPVAGGTFTATLDIYNGDNWINVGAGYNDPVTGSWIWYGDYAGVYTDTGTVWVPNISITGVTTASLTGDYGMSSDWDASLDADGIVTVTGKLKNIANGTYSLSSDGGWNSGTLTVLTDGSFSLSVTLYKGWNYVSINDANFNWYGINIYTTGGLVVVKPTITGVNGLATTVSPVGDASAATTGCTATVTGTAKAGNLNVNWNGFDGTNYYYESQTLVLSGAADTPIAFSFSVPLVGGVGSYNNIDVYDLNWMWTGVKVTTSGTCPYAPPVMVLASVLDSSTSAAIAYDPVSMTYPAGTSNAVTLTGTSSRAGRTITATVYACTAQTYTAVASSTANASGTYDWSISGIAVYDGWNNLNVTDGYNWSYPTIQTINGLLPQGPMTTTVSLANLVSVGSCGGNTWDAGTATSVTIVGTTTAPDGTGNYIDANGANKTFTITGGAFTISNVAVYNGYNYISIYDTAWNYQGVSINTTNGVAKPQYVAIASPTQTFDPVTGAMVMIAGMNTVSGTITDPVATGYAPTVVRGTVYNFATGMYTYYSSDVYDQVTYGDLPITFSASTFSFSLDFGLTGDDVRVDVYAYDPVMSVSHGVTQEFNYPWGNYSYYYKPGAKTNGAAGNQAVTSETMKQRLKSLNKNR